MAYLHCHSCDWSQDDFWTRKYNPVTKIWSDVKWLIKPRIIELDDWIVKDITKYTGVTIIPQDNYVNYRRGFIQVFSWDWLWVELIKEWKNFLRQKWWTYESWERSHKTANCPKCGKRNFDID